MGRRWRRGVSMDVPSVWLIWISHGTFNNILVDFITVMGYNRVRVDEALLFWPRDRGQAEEPIKGARCV
jgi:hypothetical protein